MDTLMEGCYCKRSEPTPISMSSQSIAESRPFANSSVDEKQETDKCTHFSIRGYVAEHRKKDWKISWPFPTLSDSIQHNNWLPPLHVTEFRWWCCQNCLRKTCAARELEAVLNYFSGQVRADSICFHENAVIASHDNAPTLPSHFHQPSERNVAEGIKVREAGCANTISCESQQLLFSDKKGKERIVVHLQGEDIQASTVDNGNAGQNLNQITHRIPWGRSKFEPCMAGEITKLHTRKCSADLTKSYLGQHLSSYAKPAFHSGNVSEAVTVNLKGNDFEHCKQGCRRDEVLGVGQAIETHTVETHAVMDNVSIGSGQKDELGFSRNNLVELQEQHGKPMEYHGMSKGGDIDNHDNVSANATVSPMNELDAMALDESDYEVSKDNENMITDEYLDQLSPIELGTSNGVLRKARKVRLLTDIIKSEILGTSGRVHSSQRDKATNHTSSAVDQSKTASNAIKDIDLNHGIESHVAVQENDSKSITGKRQSKMHRVEGKRSSLMNCLKDVARKVNADKRDKETKNNSSAIVNSKLKPDSSTKIVLYPNPKNSEPSLRRDGKFILGKKRNKNFHVVHGQSLMASWQDGKSQKVNKTNVANVENEHIGDTILHSKSEPNAVHGGSIHRGGLKSPLPTSRKGIVDKKRNKMHQVEEDVQSSLMHQPKDSSGAFSYKTITNLQRHKKASKKLNAQRKSKVPEQESLDDIPMDIVELMAKNQHERCLPDAEHATDSRYEVSEATIGMKSCSNAMRSSEIIGKEVLGLVHDKTFIIQNPPSKNACGGLLVTGKNIEEPDGKLNGPTSRRNYSNAEQSLVSTRFSTFSVSQGKPLNEVHFPITDSCRDSDRFSLNRLHFLEACHSNQNRLQENVCGPTHYGESLMPSKHLPFDINLTPEDDEFYHKEICSHVPDPLRKRNLNANTHQDHVLEPTCPNIVSHLQKEKVKDISDMKKGAIPESAFSSTDGGNEYHLKMMGPVDLYANDAISAMHLLRLMDQGVCSSNPVDLPLDDNQDKFLKQPQFPQNNHRNFLHLGDGMFKTTESSIHPIPFLFNQHHPLGNPNKHLHPLPKAGAFGSSLQGIACDSNGFAGAFGRTGSSSVKAASSSFKIHGKEKMKRIQSSPRSRGRPRSRGSISRDGDWGKSSESIPVHHGKKRFLSAGDSLLQSKNSLLRRPLVTHDEVMGNQRNEIALPAADICMPEICYVNRNPAEFSIPGPGNAYMIGHEDLGSIDILTLKDGLRLTNPDGYKRRRMMKLTAIQER